MAPFLFDVGFLDKLYRLVFLWFGFNPPLKAIWTPQISSLAIFWDIGLVYLSAHYL
jgi:hypothetical protein